MRSEVNENYTYLFYALIANSCFNDFYRLIIAVSEKNHYFVVKSINIDSLMAFFVSFYIRNILKRISSHIFGAIKGSFPKLKLSYLFVKHN